MNWKEFTERAISTLEEDTWTINAGDALYTDGEIAAAVKIVPEGYPLEPEIERIRLSESGEEVDLEYEIFEDADEEAFLSMWNERIGAPIRRARPYPYGYRPPVSLGFTPFMRGIFENYNISSTPIAPLWGQATDYFWEPVYEINSGPDQGEDGHRVYYRQDELLRRIFCPFCLLSEPTSMMVYALRPPEQEYYSPAYHVMICPRCDRAVDAVPSGD